MKLADYFVLLFNSAYENVEGSPPPKKMTRNVRIGSMLEGLRVGGSGFVYLQSECGGSHFELEEGNSGPNG